MNHYTYIVEGLGKRYIGVRSCKCDPEEDTEYFGSSKYLNQAIQEHGIDKFSKQILAIFDTRKLAAEHEIRLHEQYDVGRSSLFWNRAKHTSTGFDTTGICHTEETKQKISRINKGRELSKETKQKIGLAGKGKIISEEHKRKICDGNRGKTASKETRQKMRESKKGTILSEEHKRKIGLAGKGRVVSEETKQRMSESHTGKILSEAHKRKISNAVKGKNHPNFGKQRSEETKRRMSKAHKRRIVNLNMISDVIVNSTF